MTDNSEMVPITVYLSLGSFPASVAWRIETLSGLVLHKADLYTYTTQATDIVTETVSVPANQILNFVVIDRWSYGLRLPSPLDEAKAYLFQGTMAEPDKVLAKVPATFRRGRIVNSFNASDTSFFQTISFLTSGTGAPSASPSLSLVPTKADTTPVSVFIDFDTFSIQTSWKMVVADTNRTVGTGGPYGPFVGPNVTETLVLETDETYRFTVFDSGSDGLCCSSSHGQVFVFLGDAFRTNQALVYDDGQFARQRDHIFVASPSAVFTYTTAPSTSPSVSPVPSTTLSPSQPLVTVTVVMDGFFYLVSILDSTKTRELYTAESLSGFVRGETITLQQGAEYFLRAYFVVDHGYAMVVLGSETLDLEQAIAADAGLAYATGESDLSVLVPFTASPDSFFSSVTASPTGPPRTSFDSGINVPAVSPTASWPLPPSTQQYLVTVEIDVDIFSATRSGFWIETTNTREVVFQTTRRNFSPTWRDTVWTGTIVLEEGTDYLFTIYQTTGDGIDCCRSLSYVTIYGGSRANVLEKRLVFIDGNFGYIRTVPFTASDNNLLGYTANPTHSPTNFPTILPSSSAPPTGMPSQSLVPSTTFAPSRTLVAVLIVVDFDMLPAETGWKLELANDNTGDADPTSNAADRIVSEVVGFPKDLRCTQKLAQLMIQEGFRYTITITDTFGDGMTARAEGSSSCRGQVTVYEGLSIDPTKMLAREDGNFMYQSEAHSFMVGIPSEAPSSTPTVQTPGSSASVTPGNEAGRIGLLIGLVAMLFVVWA